MIIEPDETTSLNVIPMSPAFAGDLEITKKKAESYRRCGRKHRHVEVDEELRTITCRDCGYVIDPFEYVLEWASEGAYRMEALKAIGIKTRIANAEHEDLMRKIKNIRSRLKNAGTPQPEVERNHFDMLRLNPHIAAKEGFA